MKQWLLAGLSSLALLVSSQAEAFYAHTSTLLNGSTNILQVPFPYIEQSDVAVLVNGTAASFVWLTPSSIQISTPAASLAGDTVTVTRTTQIQNPAVIFQNGALNPLDLNTMSLQTLYAQQEIWDQFSSLGLDQIGGTLSHSGNTSVLATVAGKTSTGDCAAWDQFGNLFDTGAACGNGGSGGSIVSGAAGQIAFFNNAGVVVSATSTLPNGIGATTQGLGDASNLVATDQFVLNNATAAGRNLLFNGEFSSFERLPSVATTSTQVGVGIDRWTYGNNSSAPGGITYGLNLNGITPPVGYFGDWGFQVNTAHSMLTNEQASIRQTIEEDNFIRTGFGGVGAQNLSLSFFVRSSVVGTFGGALCNYNFPLPATRCFTFNYTVTTPNAWTFYGIAIPGDAVGTWSKAVNQGAATLFFSLGSGNGDTAAPGVWTNGSVIGTPGEVNLMATANATWNITGAQLEIANTPTAFEHITPSLMRQLCQRYGVSLMNYPLGAIGSTTSASLSVIPLPTLMRTTPSLITTAAGLAPSFTFPGGGIGPLGTPALNSVLTGPLVTAVFNGATNWTNFGGPVTFTGFLDAEFQ